MLPVPPSGCGILTMGSPGWEGYLSHRLSEGTTWTGAEPEAAAEPHAPSTTRPRVGVVLAAGRSERLAGVTGGGSKALVRVGGLALVERAVRTLLAAGLERVVVVIGYQAGPVATVVNPLAPGRVRAIFAESWELGNGASLAAAESLVAEEGLFVLVTADHVFGEGGAGAPALRRPPQRPRRPRARVRRVGRGNAGAPTRGAGRRVLQGAR